ncbi:uncharacterized protein LOC135221158 [Macrobrachium nipponense]|uniref:uncharacterized protein LOC135221158 n=1 Tax=Macrobrachium nipponense TaxID=159736 RepID=UPI0030C7C298
MDQLPIRKRTETSESVRRLAIELYQTRISVQEIARRLNCHRTTVYRWLKRYDELGLAGLENQRSGRPRCTTEEEDRQMIAFVREHPITSSTIVKRKTSLHISNSTIRRRLRAEGLESRIPATKPFLTEVHKEQRLGFALQHLPLESSFWENVIWCDEKTFYGGGSNLSEAQIFEDYVPSSRSSEGTGSLDLEVLKRFL